MLAWRLAIRVWQRHEESKAVPMSSGVQRPALGSAAGQAEGAPRCGP